MSQELDGMNYTLRCFMGEWAACTGVEGTPASYTIRSQGEYYQKEYRGGRLDVYRILDVYGITHPAQQHAIKKLLRAGNKKTQPLISDIQEAIDILERWKAMIKEDAAAGNQYSTSADTIA